MNPVCLLVTGHMSLVTLFAALEKGLKEKSAEFVEKGAEIYANG